MACKSFKVFGSVLLLTAMCFSIASADQTVYDDSRQNNWQDWSWSANNFQNTNPVHSGTYSISVVCDGWEALSFENPTFDVTAYTNITFWINGGPTGGQNLIVKAALGAAANSSSYTIPTLPANTWQRITVPLYALGVTNVGDMDRFWIANNTASTIPVFYVDDIVLISAPPPPPPSTNFITIDVAANRHAISPEIYGVAYGTTADLNDLNSPVNRLGGNNTSRYNWQVNGDNRGSDWFFESIGDTSSVAGERGDTFISNSKAAGAQPLITVPMLDWIAKLGPSRGKLASFSIAKYGLQTNHDVYMTDAGNGVKTNGQYVVGNDPNDANIPSTSSYQQNWVQHITNVWHTATNGGLRYYILDNEYSLWHETHRDVHPTGATMDEVRNKMMDYAAKIKAVDPNAIVVGPEEWGWLGYLNSGYDFQTGGSTDRANHGGKDYLPWLLDQFRQSNNVTGKRLLDVFSVHYYPQGSGEFGTNVSTATQLLRNKSTRSLWDTNYVDASWIAQKIYLIPRIKSWVATYYPGCRTAVTEYNWGAEDHMNGATVQADILGIFGREGLDLATRWTTPANTTPTYKAIKLYRNYDGNKSTFGDTSILAAATNIDNVAAFAAQRTNDGALTIMVINKYLANTVPVSLGISNFGNGGSAQVWQLNTNAISHLPNLTYTNAILNATLPAQSVTLFVLPVTATATLKASPGGSQVDVALNGQIGATYILQSSSNLTNWSNNSTGTLTSAQLHWMLPGTNSKTFYRAVKSP
ncbi:hypothetical protein Cflav_PD6477 [Pedosphaera parvula Ellin514]|uniref:Glycoside hydrolase family 44 catalytic domain-containing protein n=2 Tax=Pedosphaera TaxID=1032526 RepID=B9XDQ6_PEDPL|nr:hypothetical protein Cflav_PD6477 [Pedosphaera parvula Ellin514]